MTVGEFIFVIMFLAQALHSIKNSPHRLRLSPLHRLTTSRLFSEEDDDRDRRDRESDEDFPPLRSVGVFDPYSDDPRLAVKRVALCRDSAALVVAGTAGQVVVWRLEEQEKEAYKVQVREGV